MDYILHTLFDRLYKIQWTNYGKSRPHFEYYHAGGGLYLIHDIKFDFYWLKEADSPAEALRIARSEWKRRAT